MYSWPAGALRVSLEKSFYLEKRLHISCPDWRLIQKHNASQSLPFVHLSPRFSASFVETSFSFCISIILRLSSCLASLLPNGGFHTPEMTASHLLWLTCLGAQRSMVMAPRASANDSPSISLGRQAFPPANVFKNFELTPLEKFKVLENLSDLLFY